MPTHGQSIPELLQALHDTLRQAYPSYKLTGIELSERRPAQPEMAERATDVDVPLTPPLEEIQAHYRRLGYGQAQREGADPDQPRTEERPVLDPDIVRCRVKAEGGNEIEVRISVSQRAIVER